MSLILITGAAGSGKSTVCLRLKERGYQTVEGDQLASWYNKRDGNKLGQPPDHSLRTEAWFKKYAWMIPRHELEAFAQSNDLIFLFGVMGNQERDWNLFAQVFFLWVTNQTLLLRLDERICNNYGKTQLEQNLSVQSNDYMQAEYPSKGAILVDSSQSPDRVMNTILKSVEAS